MLHVPIYVTVNGMVPRHVDCEHCGQEYVYELVRTGVGEEPIVHLDTQEEVHRRASDAALVSLAKALATDTDAVPCPACLKYQPYMTAEARKLELGWLKRMGGNALTAMPVVAVLAVLVHITALNGTTEQAVVVAGTVAGVFGLVALAAAVAFRLKPCRPNEWSESFRAAQAEELACTRAEFSLMAREAGPFTEGLTWGQEQEYEGVPFLWVLPDEIADGDTVPFTAPDGRELQVGLSPDDSDGVFLHEDRIPNADGREYRICVRVLSIHPSAAIPADRDDD